MARINRAEEADTEPAAHRCRGEPTGRIAEEFDAALLTLVQQAGLVARGGPTGRCAVCSPPATS